MRRHKPVSEQVVVVTGASSGIGRAVALHFAQRGARVVLVARRAQLLAALADTIQRRGGQALPVPTDVADWSQVERLAHAAQERFGGVDTWVNGAIATVYGSLEHTTPDEFRRVMEVGLLGTVHGSMAAVPVLRARGGGVIINVSSVLGKRAVPYQSAYCATKFGVVGFSEAIRAELRDGIDVCTIVPFSMNTPLFDHARSKEGTRPKPFPPVYDPRLVARAIVRCAERPRREVLVGGAGRVVLGLNVLAPGLVDWLNARFARRLQFTGEPDHAADNLVAPMPEGATSRDGWNPLGTRARA